MSRGAVRVFLARVVGALGGGCGVIGVIAALSGRDLRLSPEGWLLLGILGVLISLTIFFDEHRIASGPGRE